MRILHVSYIFPPALNVADGITTVVHNVTKELVKRGHEVAVYTSNLSNLHKQDFLSDFHLLSNGVHVYYSRSLWRYKTFIVTPSIITLLSKNISNFDIIHIHDCRSFQGIFAYLFAKAKNIPYVYQPHGSYLSTALANLSVKTAKSVLDTSISWQMIKGASKIIALSKMEAMQYKIRGIPDEKIEIIPNGTALPESSDSPVKGLFRRKLGIDKNKKLILYLGRIHKTKGIDLLIEGFGNLAKKFEDSILVLVGPDDGFLGEAKSLANSLGLSDSVLFTDFISETDKKRALVDADVFVTPSFHGFPMTFLESCIAGTPIVTTTLGDRLEWMDGKVGYVTSPTKSELAEALYAIISDDKLREDFSRNCKELVRSHFSLDVVVDKLEQTYLEVLDANQAHLSIPNKPKLSSSGWN